MASASLSAQDAATETPGWLVVWGGTAGSWGGGLPLTGNSVHCRRSEGATVVWQRLVAVTPQGRTLNGKTPRGSPPLPGALLRHGWQHDQAEESRRQQQPRPRGPRITLPTPQSVQRPSSPRQVPGQATEHPGCTASAPGGGRRRGRGSGAGRPGPQDRGRTRQTAGQLPLVAVGGPPALPTGTRGSSGPLPRAGGAVPQRREPGRGGDIILVTSPHLETMGESRISGVTLWRASWRRGGGVPGPSGKVQDWRLLRPLPGGTQGSALAALPLAGDTRPCAPTL